MEEVEEANDKIAIVGIGCNFPGGEGIENFWKVIVEGRNCTVDIPSERFDTKFWCNQDLKKPGKISTSRAAVIDGFNEFDNILFGIHNSEVATMDPQQKLLLECTYRALEDAGIPAEHISGSKTGVFVGLMNHDFESICNNSADGINHLNATGTSTSIAANRISYCFNLTGPSLAIDTACSSSLVALHYACQAIKQGDCDMAICGGVSCIIEPRVYVALSKANMISPDGISKPFSQRADGYGRGEGCGVVLLKTLKRAKDDFSKVWGVLLASAVNQDGKSITPISKPSQKQQEDLLQRIYATINPSLVHYVEAHGTGTPIGDPIEAASIGNIMGKKRHRESPPLKIGSVKGNIGHTESAAGMAGLIKVLLMMHNEVIPPSLHYSEELSIRNTKELNLMIPTSPEKWEDPGKYSRIAGVNSFGFGGTNAHVVIKQHRLNYTQCFSKRPVEIFILSAVSSKSLEQTIKHTEQELKRTISTSLQNLVYTAACRRSHIHYKYRRAFLTSSLTDLQQQLASAYTETSPVKGSPRVVFVFCGNGVNHKGMCKMLLRSEPVFRNKCIEIDEVLQVYTPISMVDLLDNEFDDFSRPEIAQPLLFTIQVSLVALLRFWGIKPDSIVGHSVGEVAAAHCSGLLSLQDAVQVIYHRSTLQAKATGGKMLVVSNIPVTDISKLIEPYSGQISIAAYNSPTSCTLSGDSNLVEHIHSKLKQNNNKGTVFLHLLDVPAAYHSHMMDSILDELKANLQNLKTEKLETEIISTVTGQVASQGDFTTGEYWARNIREPVAFEQALKSLTTSKQDSVFIEIGPRRALQRYIVEVLGKNSVILPTGSDKEYNTLFAILGKLFTYNINPNWCNIYEAYKSAPAAIPKYQFDHIKQEIKYEKIRQGKQNVSTVIHPLLQCANEDMTEFISTISEATTPYIYEHRNNGSVLVPGTFYVELGLAATMTSIKPKVPLSSLEISVAFSSPCVINQQSIDLKIKLKQRNNTTNFEIQTSYIYATGQVQTKPETFEEDKKISFPHIFKRCTSYYTKDQIYDKLSKIGFQYGNVYKQLSDVHYGGDLKEAIAVINISETIKDEMYEYYIHPVILDSFLQMFACLATEYQESATFFPSSIGSLTILRPLQKKMFIYIKEVTTNENYFDICGYFVDLKGFILAEVKHAKLTSIKERTHKTDSFFFQSTWKEVSRLQYTNKSEQEPKILILTDIYGIGQQLTKYIPRGLTFIMHNNWDSTDTKIQLTKVFSNEYNDVLFMWGVHPVHEEFTSNLTQLLAKYCEVYQQVILAVRQQTSRVSIRIVTYRTTDNTVDHINPGSALIGMTRACILEMPDLKFQLIDINSSNPSTMEALAKVVLFNKPEEYPEVWIKDGNIYMNEITLSDVHVEKEKQNLVALKHSDNFTLCSVDPFKVTELSAEPIGSINNELIRKHVEVEIDKIAIHTEDYFPVTFSSYHHGSALYWHTLTKDKHKIMALDFTGTVTAVGKGVNKLKVGEYIVSCYPVVASSRVILPEMVCYSVKSVPTLRNPLCISKFILAWEILHQLPQAKNKSKLAIRTTEANSVLCKILTRIAKRSGWEPTTYSDSIKYTKECNAMIILPPLVTNLVEDFCHLSLLKDLVIICDRKNPESFHNLSESCKENVHVHFLNLDTIFQKAYIKKIAKRIYKWIKLIDVGMIPSAPHLISLFADSTNCENCTRKCYFTDTFIPLIELEKSKLSSIPLSLSRQKLFQHNSIYIVTGGLSGLGFETVKFIVQHGGGYIVIMSRRKPTPVMQQQIQMVQDEKKNTVIMSLQCNAANYSEVMKSMELILKVYPNIPIKGIFHSAVVLHDGLLQHLNVSHFEKVLSPKVEGAINLHRATINQDLDYFVCYSSIASFVGNPGQANYAAANSFLDMFCQYRRNIGLSGQSISWGALNLGLLLNQENIHSLLQARGILLLDKLEIHEHLRKALTLNNPNQAIVKFDFKTLHDNLISHIPSLKQRFFNVVLENLNNLSNTRTFNLPRDISINPENYVKSLISEITSVDVRDITGSTPLNTLGIDSMLGMTLQNQIFKETEINIPLVKLLDPNITVSMLVSMVRENIANTEEIVEDTRL